MVPTPFILVRCPIGYRRGNLDPVVGEEDVYLALQRIHFVLRDLQVLQTDNGVSTVSWNHE